MFCLKQPLHQDISIFAAWNNYKTNITPDLLTPNSISQMGQRISRLQCEAPTGNTVFGGRLSVEVSAWNGSTSAESERIWRNQANGIWPLLLKQAEKNLKAWNSLGGTCRPLMQSFVFLLQLCLNGQRKQHARKKVCCPAIQHCTLPGGFLSDYHVVLSWVTICFCKIFHYNWKKALTAVLGEITMNKCQVAFPKKWQIWSELDWQCLKHPITC